MSLNNQKQHLKKQYFLYFLAFLYGQARAPIMDIDSKLWIKYFLNNTGFKNKLMFFYLAKLLCTWPCGQISLAVQEFVIKTYTFLPFSSSISLFFLTFTFLYLRWNQGLVFHQGLVDLLRSLLLLPLAFSILSCRPIYRCLPIRNSYPIN